jgi:hypothetical protein
MNTAALTSDADRHDAGWGPETAVRPDVAVLLHEGRSTDAALTAAAREAAASGGDVRVMLCVDDRDMSSRERRREQVRGRRDLARAASMLRACDPRVAASERLHLGSLDSLLCTLEETVGAVIGSAGDPRMDVVRTVCPVPVRIVADAAAPESL